MIIVSSCIEVNHRTPLVDKNRSKDIIIFDSDSTKIYLSGHMKECNKFGGIVDTDTSKDSNDVYLCIKTRYKYPIFINDLNINIEVVKGGKIYSIDEGVIYYNTWTNKLQIGVNDTISNYYYGEEEYNSSDGLCYIDSRDKKLVGCDTLIIKPDIKLSINNNKYHIQSIDTLYRTVEKKTRFIHL